MSEHKIDPPPLSPFAVSMTDAQLSAAKHDYLSDMCWCGERNAPPAPARPLDEPTLGYTYREVVPDLSPAPLPTAWQETHRQRVEKLAIDMGAHYRRAFACEYCREDDAGDCASACSALGSLRAALAELSRLQQENDELRKRP